MACVLSQSVRDCALATSFFHPIHPFLTTYCLDVEVDCPFGRCSDGRISAVGQGAALSVAQTADLSASVSDASSRRLFYRNTYRVFISAEVISLRGPAWYQMVRNRKLLRLRCLLELKGTKLFCKLWLVNGSRGSQRESIVSYG